MGVGTWIKSLFSIKETIFSEEYTVSKYELAYFWNKTLKFKYRLLARVLGINPGILNADKVVIKIITYRKKHKKND